MCYFIKKYITNGGINIFSENIDNSLKIYSKSSEPSDNNIWVKIDTGKVLIQNIYKLFNNNDGIYKI